MMTTSQGRFRRLFFICVFATTLIAGTTVRAEDLEENPEYIAQRQLDTVCSPMMKALHKEWLESDGYWPLVVGDNMFWALLVNPNAFYIEFSTDTVAFNLYLEHLPVVVFWNPKDTTTAHLERLRAVAIERLIDQTWCIDEKYLGMHQEMIVVLRKTKVTYVD